MEDYFHYQRFTKGKSEMNETEDSKAMTLDDLKVRISESMKDSKNGRKVSIEALKKRIKHWD